MRYIILVVLLLPTVVYTQVYIAPSGNIALFENTDSDLGLGGGIAFVVKESLSNGNNIRFSFDASLHSSDNDVYDLETGSITLNVAYQHHTGIAAGAFLRGFPGATISSDILTEDVTDEIESDFTPAIGLLLHFDALPDARFSPFISTSADIFAGTGQWYTASIGVLFRTKN